MVIAKRFSKFQLFSMIVPLFSLIVGLVFVGFEKHILPNVMYIVLASIIIINGLFALIKYFYDGFANDVYKYEIVSGGAFLILGLFMLVLQNQNIYTVMGIVFGLYYLIIGLNKVYYTYMLFRDNERIYPLYLVITVLILIMSFLSLFNLLSSIVFITRLISVFLLAGSAFELVCISLFQKRSINVLKIFE